MPSTLMVVSRRTRRRMRTVSAARSSSSVDAHLLSFGVASRGGATKDAGVRCSLVVASEPVTQLQLDELSQGALREIDRTATASLRDAARRKKKLVDHDVVNRVAEALLRFD